MNIVLEGAKGTGKSTIAKHFVEKGYEYFHSSSETENDLKYHLDLLDGDKRIIDRFSLGEMIYPRVYKRESKINDSDLVETFSDPNTIYFVLFSSDNDLLVDRIKNRNAEKDHNLNFERVLESNDYFEFSKYFFTRYSKYNLVILNNIYYVDVSKLTSKEIINFIEGALDK